MAIVDNMGVFMRYGAGLWFLLGVVYACSADESTSVEEELSVM